MLYLTVMSNCSIGRAEMVVSNCIESETEDFAKNSTIIRQGSVIFVIFWIITELKQRSAPFISSFFFLQVFVFVFHSRGHHIKLHQQGLPARFVPGDNSIHGLSLHQLFD